jgi:hypothetical protein
MRTILAGLALTLLGVLPAMAQQDPRFFSKIDNSPDGSLQVTITNRSQQTITAFLITNKRTNANGLWQTDSVRVFDSAFNNPLDREILPAESRAIRLFGANPKMRSIQSTAELKAILFSDGSSFGDDEWVHRIVQRRKIVWQELADAISTLQEAKASGAPIGPLIQDMQQRQSAVAKNVRDQGLGNLQPFIYSNAAGTLMFVGAVEISELSADQKIDIALGSLYDMRQRLYYSKPQLASADEVFNPPIPPLNYFQFNFPDAKSSGGYVFVELFQDVEGIGRRLATGGRGRVSAGAYDYRVDTTFQGKPVQALRAAMYVPGCKIVNVDVPSLAGSSGSADFHCDALPLVSLTGRIERSGLPAGKQYDVWIRLLGRWTERDVMFFDIPLGIVTPDSGGVFSM